MAGTFLLEGCGGGGSTGAATATTPTTAALTTPAGVADFTTLDFNAVANYANPALPAYYDATVAALDNTPANNSINDRLDQRPCCHVGPRIVLRQAPER
jgi:cytochrome c peroxidase